MAVVELRVEVALGAVPALEELLAEREEQRIMVIEDKPSGRAWLTGFFATREEAKEAWKNLAGDLEAEWLAADPELKELADADWKESYKAHFKAWKFGPLHWVPVWERETFNLQEGEQVLWLDPGMAFGTGNHETTRLCCERLVEFAGRHGKLGRVLDAGCGSGILALSACKLGFARVTGFDNDPEAVRVSEENTALNDLAGRVDFMTADLTTGLVGRQAELVLANIQADVLVRFASELSGAVALDGQLVLSGILDRELDQVRAAFGAIVPSWPAESRTMGEWSDLVLRQR
jgi:ribosomal protein L11 methyltransferase